MFFSMYADFVPVGVNGAIHIGAGDAPELDVYASLDIPCIWIDANRQAIDNLKDLHTHNTIHRFHHAFISDKTQKDSFFRQMRTHDIHRSSVLTRFPTFLLTHSKVK